MVYQPEASSEDFLTTVTLGVLFVGVQKIFTRVLPVGRTLFFPKTKDKPVEHIPFLGKIIEPAQRRGNDVYLGIGFVGSDGQTGKLGFATLLFLYFAEQVRRALSATNAQILLMDKPNGHVLHTANEERTIRYLLTLLGAPWEIVRYSERYPDGLGSSYPEIQTNITSDMLSRGGYQVGWMYPTETATTRDELYFAKYFLSRTERTDVGFVLGDFPTIIPGGIPATPYLVKAHQEKHRLLLQEEKSALRLKFGEHDGKLAKIKRAKALSVLRVLSTIGVVDFAEPCNYSEVLVAGILHLSQLIAEQR